MRKCKRCGNENEEKAQFCKKCGAPLNEEVVIEKEIEKEQVPTRKSKNRRFWISAAVFVVIFAILLALIPALTGVKEKQDYEKYISSAEKYLEELNYEKAEAEYLKAISIKPKKKAPYISLADIYVVQKEYEKAINILEQAKEVGVEDTPSGDRNSGGVSIDEKIEEIKNEIKNETEGKENTNNYVWTLEPTIEADNIDYAKEGNIYSVNETMQQFKSSYAVIRQGNSLGVIDMAGNLKADIKYSKICSIMGVYALGPVISDDSAEGFPYYLDESGKIQEYPPTGYDFTFDYYWCDGLRSLVDENGEELYMGVESRIPEAAIPVKKAPEIYNAQNNGYSWEWIQNLEPPYAVCKNGELITDFIYDKCGTGSEGMTAVCKDGKWGYINDKGEVVIPLEYDSSWLECGVWDVEHNYSGEWVLYDYCYAASDGYINLCKGDEWELRNTKGEVVIEPGIFEKILPVYEGKCWVKQEGKWGVIQLKGEWKEDLTDNIEQYRPDLYNQIFQEYNDAIKKYSEIGAAEIATGYPNVSDYLVSEYINRGSLIFYGYYDIDSNGVEELFIGYATIDGYEYKIVDVFTQNAGQVKRVGDDDTFSEHCGSDIYENGIIRRRGGSGAYYESEKYYVLNLDGYHLNLIQKPDKLGEEIEIKWKQLEVENDTNSSTTERQEMSLADIEQAVAEHYNQINNTNIFVVIKGEATRTEEGYTLVLRHNGANTPNIFVSGIYVNIKTGEVKDDEGNTWFLY